MIKYIKKQWFEVFSRAFAAILGGYLLSNLISILISYTLSEQYGSGVTVGLLLSFLFYAAIVIWVYSVSSLKLIYNSIVSASSLCLLLVFWLKPEKLF